MKAHIHKLTLTTILFFVCTSYIFCNQSKTYYNKAKKAYQKERYCEALEYCIYSYIENDGRNLELQDECIIILNNVINSRAIRNCTTPLEWLISYQHKKATDLKKKGELQEAKSLLMSSTTMYFPLLGVSKNLDYNIALSVATTAQIFYETGYIDLAVQLAENSLTIVGRHDTTSCIYATILNTNAGLLHHIGEYELAENLYKKAIRIAESTKSCQFLATSTLGNLAELYSETGQYQKSEKLLCDVLSKCTIDETESLIAYSNNLIKLYRHTGQYDKAVNTFQHVVQRLNGESVNSVNYAQLLINHGILCADIDDYDTAIAFTKSGLDLLNKMTGTAKSARYYIGLSNLAFLYEEQGKYDLAEEYYIQALNIINQIGADNTQSYAAILNNIAYLYFEKRDLRIAEKFYVEDFNIRKSLANDYFDFMSELQRGEFFSTQELSYYLAYPRFCYYDYTHNDSISCLAYDNELFKKGLLLNTSNEIQRSILESGDSALIDKWRALQQTKERIIKLQSQSKDNHTVLAELESKAEQLDKELTKASAAYREANSQFNISWKDVQQKLKQNDTAIEFVSFQDSADVTYYALLLKKDYRYPKLIPLCTEREIAQSFDPTDKKRAAYKYSQTNHLYDNLWSKIAPYIDNGANIYYSPSGILHLMNLEAIPVDKDTYIGDKYNMNRLSSTRELVLADDNTADKTAVLYGGIKYDLSADDMAKESERYSSDEYLLAMRSIEAGADSLYRGGVRELPGTKAEAEAISRMLDSKFNTITTFFADSANEESFKALSGKRYNILHIGTHGFFWPIETASRQELFKSRMHGLDSDETARYNPLADPMQRSGLLFAGASLAISGKADSLAQNVEDGILTAKEIANIDLKDADLVVLSACETGKGEISGEGVFGLQRGFKQAGAKTIIMSLWKVNDVATKDFMLSFYKHLTNGDSKREAFKAAILDTRKGYPEPDCWASFVMMD